MVGYLSRFFAFVAFKTSRDDSPNRENLRSFLQVDDEQLSTEERSPSTATAASACTSAGTRASLLRYARHSYTGAARSLLHFARYLSSQGASSSLEDTFGGTSVQGSRDDLLSFLAGDTDSDYRAPQSTVTKRDMSRGVQRRIKALWRLVLALLYYLCRLLGIVKLFNRAFALVSRNQRSFHLAIRCGLVGWAVVTWWLMGSLTSKLRAAEDGDVGSWGPHETPGHLEDAIRVGERLCYRNGTCTCTEGFTGPLCTELTCYPACQHGKCLRAPYCTCEEGWSGISCEAPTCSRPCVHGACVGPDSCRCEEGWFGPQCVLQCEHGHFAPLQQECACDDGWAGPSCASAVCLLPCTNGRCVAPDQCECFFGWSGPNCGHDEVAARAGQLLAGVDPRLPAPSLMLHRGAAPAGPDEEPQPEDDPHPNSWPLFQRYTAHLPEDVRRFTVDSFNGTEVPPEDLLVPHTLQRFASCAAVGNSAGLRDTPGAAGVIDEHEIVLRFNNAPTSKAYAEMVGAKTTFELLNHDQVQQLVSADDARATRKGKPTKARVGEKVISLVWRAEDLALYAELRQKYPEAPYMVLAPEFLLPALGAFRAVAQRLQEAGLVLHPAPAPPSAFVAAAFLLQICQNVNLYGFDPPALAVNASQHGAKFPYRYFDSAMPAQPSALEAEHLLLRALHAQRLVTLCPTAHAARCIQMTPRNSNGVIMRAGINW